MNEREKLIRQNYEAYRDYTWMTRLEPKFRERGVEGEQLQSFREAWNEHDEKRDWAWWQDNLSDSPNDAIRADTNDVLARIEVLQGQGNLEAFDQMLAESAKRTAANNKEEEIER